MTNPSLRTRIFLSYFLLIASAGLLFNWFFANRIAAIADESFFDSFEQKVEIVVASVEDIANEIPPNEIGLGERLLDERFGEPIEANERRAYNALYAEITQLATNQGLHIMLIYPDEELVLFDSQPYEMPYLVGEWEEVWQAIESEEPIQREYEELDSVYRAVPIFYENGFYGNEDSIMVRVGESWFGTSDTVRSQQQILAVSTLFGGVILLLALGSWMANALTKPLTELRRTVQEMATGNLGSRSTTNAPAEIEQLAWDFNQMAEAVESMVVEQKAFASNAAHELRTPLTAIRIRTETLLEDDPDQALTRQYIYEIDDEARRLTRLVEDLRFLSHTDAQNLTIGNEQVDVGRLLATITQEFEPQIRTKNIDYQTILGTEPLLLQASLAHLHVILRNLVENAIKYTPEDGSIIITVKRSEDDLDNGPQLNDMSHAEHETCSERRAHAHIVIEDTGMGIPEDELALIFNRFYRVDKARNRKIPGSGLGLSLVQSLVALYEGKISIESDGLGQGTTATLTWPLGSKHAKRPGS
ncbi:MAG: HAMP domain-containing sensor histidine kinase [Chloroflexota bacterium]